ncbi:hypothetical protein HR12_44040, partial [Microbacterium sp. SUBG005]
EEFYAMYRAFCEAVSRVDPSLTVGGPSLAFSLDDAPYREGFLAFVRENDLPLHFYSFLWFTDAPATPLDYRYVSAELRAVLDRHGFTDTELTLSYWNYLAVPSSSAPRRREGRVHGGDGDPPAGHGDRPRLLLPRRQRPRPALRLRRPGR